MAVAVAVAVSDTDNRTDSDDSDATLSIHPLISPSSLYCSSRPPTNITNLDSFLDSVTPIVPAQKSFETSLRGQIRPEAEVLPFYCLEDLWETFREWSAYGAGVPLLLHGRHPTTQYYVPFLYGIQLYIDPQKPRMRLRYPGEENNAKFVTDASSHGDVDREVDRWTKFVLDGSFASHNLMNSNRQQWNRHLLRDKRHLNVWSDKAEVSTSPGSLVFEYMEQEQPHSRKPLADKVSALASRFPELINYRSCDLSPPSWMCVAWYPIYRIPVGPTLKDIDASFLTFHSLSTQPGGYGDADFLSMNGWWVRGELDPSSRVRLPVVGLVSYKLKGSIITPYGPRECEQDNALLEAVSNWLHHLQALLPDYQFFLNRYS